MRKLLDRELVGCRAQVAYSTRRDGDLSPSAVAADVLLARRRSLVDLPWCSTRQVHGDRVVRAGAAIATAAPVAGDAMVTDELGVVLAVHSGDCPTIGFVHDSGAIAATHAGWRGLEVGVVESTVRALRARDRRGVDAIQAVVGPHIRASRYEFGEADLDRLARRFGVSVVSHTADGRPALDLTAAIARELDRLDVEVATWATECTADDADNFWSYRARRESGRVALFAWMESP